MTKPAIWCMLALGEAINTRASLGCVEMRTCLATFAIAVFLASGSRADSIRVGKKILDRVHITETPSAYIVRDPADGGIQTISKKRTDVGTVDKSEDRTALLKEWHDEQRKSASEGKRETKTLLLTGDAEVYEAVHTDFLRRQSVRRRAQQQIALQQEAQAEAERQKQLKAEAAAEAAAERLQAKAQAEAANAEMVKNLRIIALEAEDRMARRRINDVFWFHHYVNRGGHEVISIFQVGGDPNNRWTTRVPHDHRPRLQDRDRDENESTVQEKQHIESRDRPGCPDPNHQLRQS